MSFDLSSSCIGCAVAKIDKSKVTKMRSCPIIPDTFDPRSIGFKNKSKKAIPGKSYSSYIYKDEDITKISKAEKKKRDVLVRNHKDSYVLKYISYEMNTLIAKIKPDVILVEKNEIFNGVLTSVLLGKVIGTLHAICSVHDIPIQERKVQSVRKKYNLPMRVSVFCRDKDKEELTSIPDITKRVIRDMLQKKYAYTGVKLSTDDEGDAALLIDHFVEYEGCEI